MSAVSQLREGARIIALEFKIWSWPNAARTSFSSAQL
jgi:hypothetical protein